VTVLGVPTQNAHDDACDWVSSTLAAATAIQADLVAGLTALLGWEADRAAHEPYARLLQAGISAGGHRHVYVANLAVRYPVFARLAASRPGSTVRSAARSRRSDSRVAQC
jgi:hypothetical protein